MDPYFEMEVTDYTAGSCAIMSLEKIGSCSGPVEVLTTLCESELGKLHKFRDTYGTLACFFVFSAGPEVKGFGHSKSHWLRYGTEFAKYLVDNKLGEVVTLGPKRNLKHHPKTTAQIWVWSPDQKAVEKWWTNQQKRKE